MTHEDELLRSQQAYVRAIVTTIDSMFIMSMQAEAQLRRRMLDEQDAAYKRSQEEDRRKVGLAFSCINPCEADYHDMG